VDEKENSISKGKISKKTSEGGKEGSPASLKLPPLKAFFFCKKALEYEGEG